MIIEINHETRYNYETEVLLNPHILYLTIQNRNYYKITHHSIIVDPEPTGLNALIDLENSSYYQAWFGRYTNHLNIKVQFIVEAAEFNPLHFIYDSRFTKLSTGFDYGGYKNNLIEVYLHQLFLPELKSFALEFFHATSDIVTFLHSINAYIHQHWQHEIRIEPGFQHPLITFSDKRGSCRDLAYMMMEMLKSVGLASRFVSGYAYNPSLSEEHNLHAWIDIYMPGAGWIGIDPSLGLFCDHHYFPLAASYEPSNTLPVIGTFGGTSGSELYTFVDIQEKN
jgi:hypothetical protein